MAGDEGVANWIADKLKGQTDFSSVASIGSGFLELGRKNSTAFTAVAIGVKDIITRDHITPLFALKERQPQFVVNVPSKAIWSGPAIDFIHEAPAAFGTYGELVRASREEAVSSYRHREYSFFERAFRQHTAVREVTRVYDKVFRLHRTRGLPDIVLTLIDAYDMSAEDIRQARERYGRFDAAVKISSYGSITSAAHAAAGAIAAEAFTLRDLMRRLNKP